MVCRVKKILRRLIFAFTALGAMGARRAFLLTTQHASAPQGIPEPSAFLLMLMGLMLLGLVRKQVTLQRIQQYSGAKS